MVSGRLIPALRSSQKHRRHSVYKLKRLFDSVRRFIVSSTSLFKRLPSSVRSFSGWKLLALESIRLHRDRCELIDASAQGQAVSKGATLRDIERNLIEIAEPALSPPAASFDHSTNSGLRTNGWGRGACAEPNRSGPALSTAEGRCAPRNDNEKKLMRLL